MFVVVSMTHDDVDSWAVHDTREAAQAEYEMLLDDANTYTASICEVIESTDYLDDLLGRPLRR